MKRTAIKRSEPPKRKAWLKPIGKRVLREMEARRNFKKVVLAKAKGKCQRCGYRPGHWTLLQAHHIKAKSQGGSHDPKTNGAALCIRCHRLVHDHNCDDWRKWLWTRKEAGR